MFLKALCSPAFSAAEQNKATSCRLFLLFIILSSFSHKKDEGEAKLKSFAAFCQHQGDIFISCSNMEARRSFPYKTEQSADGGSVRNVSPDTLVCPEDCRNNRGSVCFKHKS